MADTSPAALRAQFELEFRRLNPRDPLIAKVRALLTERESLLEALRKVVADMKQRESDLFFREYPRTPYNATEQARAGALSELQKWRGKVEALEPQP